MNPEKRFILRKCQELDKYFSTLFPEESVSGSLIKVPPFLDWEEIAGNRNFTSERISDFQYGLKLLGIDWDYENVAYTGVHRLLKLPKENNLVFMIDSNPKKCYQIARIFHDFLDTDLIVYFSYVYVPGDAYFGSIITQELKFTNISRAVRVRDFLSLEPWQLTNENLKSLFPLEIPLQQKRIVSAYQAQFDHEISDRISWLDDSDPNAWRIGNDGYELLLFKLLTGSTNSTDNTKNYLSWRKSGGTFAELAKNKR